MPGRFALYRLGLLGKQILPNSGDCWWPWARPRRLHPPGLRMASEVSCHGFDRGRSNRTPRCGRGSISETRGPGMSSRRSPIAAKHRATRGGWHDQRPARNNTVYNPVKSAKPPSPVQIRAAPPISQFKFDRLCVSRTSGRMQFDYGGLQIGSLFCAPGKVNR
jgi:hypothetical protein